MSEAGQSREFVATGDVALAAALNAVGVPPDPKHPPVPVKRVGGDDFVRIHLSKRSVDARFTTRELMDRWREGSAAVRRFRDCPFSALQVWSRSRASWMRAGAVRLVTVRCGRWSVLVPEYMAPRWGTEARPLGSGEDAPGVDVGDAGLAAALMTLGARPIGVVGCGERLAARLEVDGSDGRLRAVMEGWPGMLADLEDVASYLAAAEQNRAAALEAIRRERVTLYGTVGPAMAAVDEEALKTGDEKTEQVWGRLGNV